MTTQRGTTPGLPTNSGSFKAHQHGASDLRLVDPVTLTLTNINGERPHDIEIDLDDPLGCDAPSWLAKDTQRPDLINRLAEQVRDSGDDRWDEPNALGEHNNTTYPLIGNPVLDDTLRADLIDVHVDNVRDHGSGGPSRLATHVENLDGLGPASIEALSKSPDRDVLRLLARRDDLNDEQIERLCDRPEGFYGRADTQMEVARDYDGIYDDRVRDRMVEVVNARMDEVNARRTAARAEWQA